MLHLHVTDRSLRAAGIALCGLILGLSGCGSKDGDSGSSADERPTGPVCAGVADAPSPLPGVTPEQLTLGYWLETLAKQVDLDAVLLTPEEIARLNASFEQPRDKFHPQIDLLAPLDVAKLTKQVTDRRTWAADELGSGKLLAFDGKKFARADLAILDREVPLAHVEPQLRVALADIQILCTPLPAPFFTGPNVDTRYDRNACSTAHAQEVVQVLAAWPNGQKLARTRYAMGWIESGAPLSPPIPHKLVAAFVSEPRVETLSEVTLTGDESEVGAAARHKPKKANKPRGKRTAATATATDPATGAATASPAVTAPATATPAIPAGTLLAPADPDGKAAIVATESGFVTKPLPDALRTTHRPLTRRAMLEEVFRYLDSPYGLGGHEGGRDCSRLLLDVFETFDLHLPRHSSWQSLAGSFSIDVSEVTEAERLRLIDAAARRGIVLLHFPGHVMLYLGKSADGTPMVIHAFGEYLRPCPDNTRPERDKPETLVRVDKVTVSDLELGRNTSRTAFSQRITRITVLGPPPGRDLEGVAELRPAAPIVVPEKKQCRHGPRSAIFYSPQRPNSEQPLHVVASTNLNPGPATLTLIDPDGVHHTEDLVRLGGPPYGMVATVMTPRPGAWTAVYGDGDDVLSCQRLYVRRRKPDIELIPNDGPVWPVYHRWGSSMERLYSLFVERLFDYPFEEEKVWPNLHTLLRDKERNILYNHLNLDEDEELELQPDCADLPYALRTYFAWKLRLPVGFHVCKRVNVRKGKPPICEWIEDRDQRKEQTKRKEETVPEMLLRRQAAGAGDNLMSRLELADRRRANPKLEPRDDIDAFNAFLKTEILNAAHSSTGRTQPEEEETDLYPVPLTRAALRPGTVYIDPYGHVMIIAGWIPQGTGDHFGALIAADAQPDGTIGRRRFWRGSFLFKPDTELGGAGFKAFRPRRYKNEPIALEVYPEGHVDSDGEVFLGTQPPVLMPRVGYTLEMTNKELRRTRTFTRYSLQQYQGSADDFYETVEAVINPRPLDPIDRQLALVEAFQEQVARRVVSVKNGEEFMAEHQFEPMEMPEGARIFLASDPWESYSTPSRDLRLLISIDTVMKFVDTVKRHPEQFAMDAGDVDAVVARVVARRDAELAQRTISYVRSDGSKATITLRDIVDRAKGFEMAYNPNDCVEVRWAAPEGSDERKSCNRHAPPEQRAEMQRLRGWFQNRERPPN